MAPKQTEKILVVDEEGEVVELIAGQVLGPLGYAVTTARDGASALQMMLQAPPDILITALDLPGLSGRDLLTAVRTQGLETIVIALGPRGAESQALQAFRLGAKDYLSKPVREAEVVSTIDRSLAELRLRRDRQLLAEKLAGANRQLEKRIKELTTLASIGKAVTALTNLSQLFGRLLEAGMFVTEAEVGWLVLADDASGTPILRAGKNLPNVSSLRINQAWDDGLSSLLMMSGEGLTLAGPALAKLRAGSVVKAAAAAPLKARDKVVGVLVVGNRTGRPFTERDQAMLAAVADYAVIALVNARLLQAMEMRAQTLQQTIDQLAKAADGQVDRLQKAGQQVRQQLDYARGILDQMGHGSAGNLTPLQSDTVSDVLARLATAQHALDELTGAPPARQAALPIDPPARA